ncbi:hypothetical protein [Aquimarina longa]|nr:hypothetical protein [Aquimarina longa]
MKILKIELEENELENAEFVLQAIGKAIEHGFYRGIEFPVNWHLEAKAN